MGRAVGFDERVRQPMVEFLEDDAKLLEVLVDLLDDFGVLVAIMGQDTFLELCDVGLQDVPGAIPDRRRLGERRRAQLGGRDRLGRFGRRPQLLRAGEHADGAPAWLEQSIGLELAQQLLECGDGLEGLGIALAILRQAGLDAFVQRNLNHQHVLVLILAAAPDRSGETERPLRVVFFQFPVVRQR